MMISFTCAGCGKAFEAAESLVGRKIRCKRCGALTAVPAIALGVFEPVPLKPLAPRPAPPAEVSPKPSRSQRRHKPRAFGRDGWVSLAIGSVLAVVALVVPWVGIVPEVLKIVIHELGHTATAWLFGSPSLPSFDLSYGGGVTIILPRQPILIVAVYAGFAFLMFRVRDDRPALIATSAAVGLYSLAAFTSLRALLFLAMGHGTELLIAGVFLYRALSGSQVLRGAERPLYAFLGLYIVLSDAAFALQLMGRREHREAYGEAKGGGDWMDFSRIAAEHLHCDLEKVAALFLLACALPPVAAFLIHRYRRGKLK
jgi:hypothetical protein